MEVRKQKTLWVEDEFKTIDLGDTRLNERAKTVISAFAAKPCESIPSTFSNSWSEIKAAYRFIDNDKVNSSKILEPHKNETINRIKSEKVVLIPQDTTQFHYRDANLKGVGPLSHEKETGFLNHVAIAVTPDGVNLGIVSSLFWARKALGKKKKGDRTKKPIEEKESYRWIEGYRVANEIAQQVPDTLIISVQDREGDIYELFEELDEEAERKAHYLVRVTRDRSLLDEESDEKNIYANVAQAPILGKIEITTPRNSTKKSRQACLTLRTSRVTLRPPVRTTGVHLLPVEITIVSAEEENAPKNEKPIHWMLATSLEILTLEQAAEVIQFYVRRWSIEVFFRILKTGCRVERLQFEQFCRLQVSIALYSIVAWRIQMLTSLGKQVPQMPCNVFFEDIEWKAAYIIGLKKPPPKVAPPLGEMCIIIAKFGGFIGRKSDGFPGAQTLWLGLQRVKDFAIAWEVCQAMATRTDTYG